MAMSSFRAIESSSSLLNSPFSDQSHLQFYNCRDAFSSSSTKPFISAGSRLRLRKVNLASLSLQALSNSSCAASSEQTRTQQFLMQELAELKLQLEQKKKDLKAHMKEEKKKGGKKIVESKDEKRSKKMAKKAMKAQKKKMKGCSSESSSSSESSDCECEEAVSMKTMREGNVVEGDRKEAESSVLMEESESTLVKCMSGCKNRADGDREVGTSSSMSGESGSQSHVNKTFSSSASGSRRFGLQSHGPCPDYTSNRIDVCTGGKCKRAGSEQLLLALQGQIHGSSDVLAVPCKCMGKCGLAINIRVHKEDTNPQHHCHVGVEDAGLILSHHFGLGRPASGLPMCPSMAPKALPVPAV